LVEALPFEMIGMGVDSIGEFEIEDPSIHYYSEFRVQFTKVYPRSSPKGGDLKHIYYGRLFECGMGGYFGLLSEEKDGTKFCTARIGVWFMGRPKTCSGDCLALEDIADTGKMGAWSEMLRSIEAKAAANKIAVTKKIAEIKVPASFFEKNPHWEIYQLPIISEADPALDQLRNALVDRVYAETETTSIVILRQRVEEAQASIGAKLPVAFEAEHSQFEMDPDEKFQLRLQLLHSSFATVVVASHHAMQKNMHRIPDILETLERRAFDVTDPEVIEIVTSVSKWIGQPPPMTDERVVEFHSQLYEMFERASQQDLKQDSEVPLTEEPDDVTLPHFVESVERHSSETRGNTVAKLLSSISLLVSSLSPIQFLKNLKTGADAPGNDNAEIEIEEDDRSDFGSEHDSDSDSEQAIIQHGKYEESPKFLNPALAVLGAVAFGSVLGFAYFLGKFLVKRPRSDIQPK
jgi:hypothetical protein